MGRSSFEMCVCCGFFFLGKKFENTEMFGQYPLQVNGFKDLHECLEAAMVEGEIESLHSAENCAKSGQEVSILCKCNWSVHCTCTIEISPKAILTILEREAKVLAEGRVCLPN